MADHLTLMEGVTLRPSPGRNSEKPAYVRVGEHLSGCVYIEVEDYIGTKRVSLGDPEARWLMNALRRQLDRRDRRPK